MGADGRNRKDGDQEVRVKTSWYKGVMDINSCLGALFVVVIPRYRGACDYDKVRLPI